MIDRTAKRKQRMHLQILDSASNLINEKGSAAVTLDEISRYADISRKTIYNHFDNKEALIHELVMPLCNHAKDRLTEMKKQGTITREEIWHYCIELWLDQSLNANIFYHVNPTDYTDFESSRHGFVYVFRTMLSLTDRYKDLSTDRQSILADLIYKTYLPLLESVKTLTDYETCFINGMNGLLDGILKDHCQ